MSMPNFDDLPENVQQGIQQTVVESMQRAVQLGEHIFRFLHDSSKDMRWDPESPIFQYDDEQLEVVVGIGETLTEAINTGNFDHFAACLAMVMASDGFGDSSRNKWELFPLIARNTWRVARDTLKEEMQNEVDELLRDIFGKESD